MRKKVINNTVIYGYVYQLGTTDRNRLQVKTVKNPNSPNFGKEFIQGELDVAEDEDGLNVIPIHFTYVTRYQKDGKTENRTYGILKSLVENESDKTWISAGKENAAKVKVTTSLDVNDFYSIKQNQLVAALQIRGSFVDNVSTLPVEDERNKFEADILFNRASRIEADEEKGIEQDYLELGGAVFNFKGELLPLKFCVRVESGMEYFESLDISSSNPQFMSCIGHVNCMTVRKELHSESVWGEAKVDVFENKSKTLDITGIQKVYDFGDEDNGITAEELKTKMQDRQIKLAAVKKDTEDYQASKEKTASSFDKILPKDDNDEDYDF